MSIPATRRTSLSEVRPAVGRVFVACAAIITVIVVGAVSLFASPASATPLTTARNAVGVHAQPARLRVGAHESIPAGQGRARAPNYDQNTVGSCVGAEAESSTASDLAGAACGGQSFTASTEVRLADGTSIPIDDVRVGDKVLATDPKTGKTQAEPVTALWVNDDTDLLDLNVHTSAGDATIDTTQLHLFYDLTTHTWVQADALHPGDQLYTANGQLAIVVGTLVVSGAADMWDLTVANEHDFYVDTVTTELLVHNCPGGDENPPSEETIHSTLRGGDRGIQSSEVIQNAENMYYDENGNQVYRWSQPGGNSQIVIRNPANGNILTNQLSSNQWIEQQIQSGRWYDLQGG